MSLSLDLYAKLPRDVRASDPCLSGRTQPHRSQSPRPCETCGIVDYLVPKQVGGKVVSNECVKCSGTAKLVSPRPGPLPRTFSTPGKTYPGSV